MNDAELIDYVGIWLLRLSGILVSVAVEWKQPLIRAYQSYIETVRESNFC